MNDNENRTRELELQDFDFETAEGELSAQLEEAFSDLSLLEEERRNIANPDSLGKTILDEVWKQFGTQIGLDLTNETLIQQYDREHPESYEEVGAAVHGKGRNSEDEKLRALYEQERGDKYVDAREKMKTEQERGRLNDTYTGKSLKQGESFDADHVISSKELFENQRRKQANLSTGELANKEENVVATNPNLNRSKQDKSVEEFIATRDKREKDLIAQNERANKKVTESNLSDVEKRLQIEKNNKALQNKLDADNELMEQAYETARKSTNKDITKGVVKQTAKKATKDTLKTVAISALFALLQEIMNGFIRFLKSQAKSFGAFLAEMKNAIHAFIGKIVNVVQTGVSTLIGTILSEIWGPIVSTFKRLASFIKQGVSSFVETFNYLKDPNNKSQPLSIKIAQIGKIVTAGLTVVGGLVLGELIEDSLLTIPTMQTPIPALGTLANIIGLFLGSLISGIIGAMILNRLVKFIADTQKGEITKDIVSKNNEILNIQKAQLTVAEGKLVYTKEQVKYEIWNRHKSLEEDYERMERSMIDPRTNMNSEMENYKTSISNLDDEFEQMQKELADLL